MTAAPEQTTTTYHFVMSYAASDGRVGDFSATADVPAGATRLEVYQSIRDDLARQHFNGRQDVFAVTGFSLGLNQL